MTEFKWPLQKDSITFRDKANLIKYLMFSNKFTQGPKVEEFEKAWSKWLGAKYSLFVTSGSTANFLLISSIMEYFNMKKGDKVLLPACTWVTNINPIIQLGLTPVFCDISLSHYSYDEDMLHEVAKIHPDIKFVFVTHLLGIPAPVHRFKKILPDAIFIDDVCESHGCTDVEFNKVGSKSLGATFSFYFGHHMSTIEGGMISTDNPHFYDLMRMKRSHGLARNSHYYDHYANVFPDIDKQFLFVTDGYNFRNTELGAVLGLSQLKRLDKFIEIRRQNYAYFTDIINHNKNKFYSVPETSRNSSFCFPFICKDSEIKNDMINIFKKEGIEYRPIVGGNLLRQPYLKDYSMAVKKEIYNADILHENGVYIGNNQFVDDMDMFWLEDIVRKI